MSSPGLRNLIEDHASEAYQKIVGHYPQFCGCETCRLDVLIYALNRLPPRYVVGLEGTIVTGINGETLILIGSGSVLSSNVSAGTQALALGNLQLTNGANGAGLASNYVIVANNNTDDPVE